MPTPISTAAVTLMMVVTLQMIVMTVWIFFREPNQIIAVWNARKTAIWIGLTSMGGSLAWFTAFSLQNAAYVKALGQFELLLSLAASYLFFKEKISKRELSGLLFLTASILLLMILV
jgi:drug/metabolite transporter (DMT)-like permease